MTAFAMLLPPQWVLVDLTRDRRSGVQDVVRGWLQGLSPAQEKSARPVLLSRLEALTSDLAEQGFLALAVEAAGLNEIGVRPMLVVRSLEVPAEVEPLDILIGLAGTDPTAEIMDIDHMVGLKVTGADSIRGSVDAVLADLPEDLQNGAASAEAQEAFAALSHRKAHRRRYLLGVPDDRSRWVELFGSVAVGDDNEGEMLAEAYLALFDALARSFEWRQ